MNQRKMGKLLAGLGVVAGLMLAAANRADGSFQLRLTQGSSVVTVTDQNFSPATLTTSPDLTASPGTVTFSGVVGTFTINVTTGVSKDAGGPFTNTPFFAHMDLNSLNVGVGDLKIELTDTGFLPTGIGMLNLSVGGTVSTSNAGNTANFDVFKSTANTEFHENLLTDVHGSVGPFGPGAFAGSSSTPHGPLGTYSMTLVATIHHVAAGSTSFDLDVENIAPEPGSLALWSMLAGLGTVVGWRGRRRNG